MELDPIKLLCSGNPLDALIALLKKQLSDAIEAAKGAINGAILALKSLLKDALSALMPSLPAKPSFLLELMELKSKIGGAVTEFKAAADALIEKWGKVVGNIKDLINSLANLSICDLLTLNFKMNPDGTIVLEGAPPKTPTSGPEIPAEAPVTTTNNLPMDFSKKTSAAVDGGNAITKTIEDGELFQLKISADSNLASLVSTPGYISFESKCKNQGISLSDTNVQNLTALEKTIQQDYIVYSQDIEEIKVAINACKSSCVRVNEQLLQLIKQNNGKISSEDAESILGTLPSLIDSITSHTLKTPSIISATESTAKSLESTLTSQWKAIAERSAMQININGVEVVEGQKFAEWFDAQGFKNFSSTQFTSYFNRPRNSTPPSSIWKNIVPTLRIVDKLQDSLGGNIRITSSYRSPAYNANIDGAAKSSFHTKFMALDIQVDGKSPSQVFNTLKSWRNQGMFSGGLGLYSSFVHIDTRGYNSTW